MPESARPPVWPQLARAPAAPAKPVATDPRAAFFGQALSRAAASPAAAVPQSSASAPTIAPVRVAVPPEAADPARPPRPGSLLNIRV